MLFRSHRLHFPTRSQCTHQTRPMTPPGHQCIRRRTWSPSFHLNLQLMSALQSRQQWSCSIIVCPLIYTFPQCVDANHFVPIVLVFLTAFLPQIPVIHTPTLRFEIKPQIFIRAMQACGAIFVKTPVAHAFVEKTLSTCRDLIRDFVRVYLQLVGVQRLAHSCHRTNHR